MPVLVILSRKALEVIFASRDWALLWPLILVSEHMCLQILEDTTAFWKRAKSLFSALVIDLVTAAALATDE
jgi:hypothetical protein